MSSQYLQNSINVHASFLRPLSESREADDTSDSRQNPCPTSSTSLPSGSLISAALSAAGVDLSSPEGSTTRGTKRKCADDQEDPSSGVNLDLSGNQGHTEKGYERRSAIRGNRRATLVKHSCADDREDPSSEVKLDLSGNHGDTKDEDEVDDGTYFPQRAPAGWTPQCDVDSPQPATKKIKHTALDSERSSHWIDDAIGWQVAPRSDEAMEYEAPYSISDSDMSSSDESDTCDSEPDSSSSDDDSDSSDNDDSSDSDAEEDVKCPPACPCSRLSPPELTRIPRAHEVLKPLLHKFLKYRTMKLSNRLYYECCERECKDAWYRVRSGALGQDYAESDLQVEHFSWGSWPHEIEEEEPECDDSCLCNTGRSTVNIKWKLERKEKFQVLTPLYQRVLQRQLLRDENRLVNMCCDNRCALYHWKGDKAIAKRQIKKDYHKSDLSVIRYSWGDWKPDDEEEEEEEDL